MIINWEKLTLNNKMYRLEFPVDLLHPSDPNKGYVVYVDDFGISVNKIGFWADFVTIPRAPQACVDLNNVDGIQEKIIELLDKFGLTPCRHSPAFVAYDTDGRFYNAAVFAEDMV